MDITLIQNIVEIVVKLISPYLCILIFKLIFKNRLQLNISYFFVAIILNIYLLHLLCPVIGVLDAIKCGFMISIPISIVVFISCWGLNFFYTKIIKLVNQWGLP